MAGRRTQEETKEVMFTDWRADKSETFVFFNVVWSVRMAKKILIENPRRSVEINPSDWRGFIQIIQPAPIETPIDFRVPIICIKWWKGYFPIDGWHRLEKALELGIMLPSVRLDANESSLVRMP